jgi:hypothetical protein
MIDTEYRGPGVYADFLVREPRGEAICAVLGRALWLSTRFEDSCKSVLMHLRFDQNLQQSLARSEPQTLDQVGELIVSFSVQERAKKLAHVIDQIGPALTEEAAVDVLHQARRARNYVAHDAASELEFVIDDAGQLSEWRSRIAQNVRYLANGDRMTSAMISIMTGEPVMNKSAAEDYVNDLVLWVCDTGA